MLQQDSRKEPRHLQKSVLELRLSLFGLRIWINAKETGRNLDAKDVKESFDKKKQ
jgi:hypothetical protein